MVESDKSEELEILPVRLPPQLRKEFQEVIKGLYASESEAVRDFVRKFVESRR